MFQYVSATEGCTLCVSVCLSTGGWGGGGEVFDMYSVCFSMSLQQKDVLCVFQYVSATEGCTLCVSVCLSTGGWGRGGGGEVFDMYSVCFSMSLQQKAVLCVFQYVSPLGVGGGGGEVFDMYSVCFSMSLQQKAVLCVFQ